MTWDELVAIGLALPATELSTWFRTPSLKVKGKGFCRLKEDAETVVFVTGSNDEQQFLLEVRPDLYFITDHYRGGRGVLARLDHLDPDECRARLERCWEAQAPASVLKAAARG